MSCWPDGGFLWQIFWWSCHGTNWHPHSEWGWHVCQVEGHICREEFINATMSSVCPVKVLVRECWKIRLFCAESGGSMLHVDHVGKMCCTRYSLHVAMARCYSEARYSHHSSSNAQATKGNWPLQCTNEGLVICDAFIGQLIGNIQLRAVTFLKARWQSAWACSPNELINFQQFLNLSFGGHRHCSILIPDEITSKIEANWSSAFMLEVVLVLELVNNSLGIFSC